MIPHLLKTFGWPAYSKEAHETNGQLRSLVTKENIERAVSHAQQVKQHHIDAGTAFPANPSTLVDELIHAINDSVSEAHKFL